MIQQLGMNYLNTTQAGASPASLGLDQRLAPQAGEGVKDDNIDLLYAQLKQLWEANPDISSTEIIDCLRKFEAADGSRPYQAIPTHTPALAQVMNRFKEEGGEGSPIYAALYKGVGLAVVSNGILNSFMGKMISLPEEPEDW